MKKTFKLMTKIFVVLFAGSLFFSLTACNKGEDNPSPSPSEHVHTFSEDWTYDETNHWHKATCEHTDEKGSLAPHDLTEWTTKTKETCTEAEVLHRTCKVCGYEETKTGKPATGHSFETDWTYDDTNHWHKASCGHDVVSDKAPHAFPDDWTIKTPATCLEDGLKEKVCSCGYKITQSIPKLGHSLKSWALITEPNEEETGSIELTCEHDSSHKQTVILPKLDEVNYSHYMEEGNCIDIRNEHYKLLDTPNNRLLFKDTMANNNEKFFTELFAYKFGNGTFSEACHPSHSIAINAPSKSFYGSVSFKCEKCGYSHSARIPELNSDVYSFSEGENGKWIYKLYSLSEATKLVENEFSEFVCADIEGCRKIDLVKMITSQEIIGEPLDIIDVNIEKQNNGNLRINTKLENSTKYIMYNLDFEIMNNTSVFNFKYIPTNDCANPLIKEVYLKDSFKIKQLVPAAIYNHPDFLPKLTSIKVGTLPPTEEEINQHATAKHTNVYISEEVAPTDTNPGKIKVKCGKCNQEFLVTIPTLNTAGVYTYYDTMQSCSINHVNYYKLKDNASNRALFDNAIMKNNEANYTKLFELQLAKKTIQGVNHEDYTYELVKIPTKNEQGLGKVICNVCNDETTFSLPSLNYVDYDVTSASGGKVKYTINDAYVNSLHEVELSTYYQSVHTDNNLKKYMSFEALPISVNISFANVQPQSKFKVTFTQLSGKTIETVTSPFTLESDDYTNFVVSNKSINCGKTVKQWKLSSTGADKIIASITSGAKFAPGLKQELMDYVFVEETLSDAQNEQIGTIDHASFVVKDAHWDKANTDFTLDTGSITIKCAKCNKEYTVTFAFSDIYDEPQGGGEAEFNPVYLSGLFKTKYPNLSNAEIDAITDAIITFDQNPATKDIF